MDRRKKLVEKSIRISLQTIAYTFFFSLLCFPDYIGFRFGIAWNLQRIIIVIALIWILRNNIRANQLLHTIGNHKGNWLILLYLSVCFLTMVVRKDLGSFMRPMMDYVMTYYLTLYFLKYEIKMDSFFRFFILCVWICGIFGILEAIFKFNVFSIFPTIEGLGGSGIERDAAYRICVNGRHPLGYGLYLLLAFPLVCFNQKQRTMDILNNPILEILILVNVFCTGSRSTLGLALFEIVLVLIFSRYEQIKKAMVVLLPLILAMCLSLILFSNSELVHKLYVKLVVMFDGAFNTNYAGKWLNYNSLNLEGSSNYRYYLPKIFTLPDLNPFLGLGIGHNFHTTIEGIEIQSIDNFYVSQYIKYAYPGLFTLSLFLFSKIKDLLISLFTSRDDIFKVFFIGLLVYFINLWFVDDLETLKLIFMIFGVLTHRRESHI